MRTITLNTLQDMKSAGEKFAVLAAYDASFASYIEEAGVEVVLVGDSLGMTVQGHDSTLPVTMEQMIYHTQAVKRGTKHALIMADMPFMSYADSESALKNAALLMQAGAHIVKLEGGTWLAETLFKMAERGMPSCVHLGLTPQSVNKLGGYKVQGREASAAQTILADAVEVESVGADILLLECVPAPLAREVTQALRIPVIGIGAGADTDAQVLVAYDMLGLTLGRAPKFNKNFLQAQDGIAAALRAYVHEVKTGLFPAPDHCFK